MDGRLYFHSPCFDGIVSAVLTVAFLETVRGWEQVELEAVNYDRRGSWLQTPLHRPAAVVDFLYHGDAEFWADHHPTAFLTEAAEAEYEQKKSEMLIYSKSADSCAGLLWQHLHSAFGHRNEQYREMVEWAEKTDSARYSSVEEAIWGDAPALRINLGLARGGGDRYCEGLVEQLRQRSLSEVAELAEVANRYDETRRQIAEGIKRLQGSVTIDEDQIVTFDVSGQETTISRYAPFHFYSQASYSIGIVRWETAAKITAMRNPWRDFQSIELGELFRAEGGGGHQRVGSLYLREPRAAEATAIFHRLLGGIREAIAAQSRGDKNDQPV